MLNEPEPAYHGVVYTEALGEAAFIGRARTVPLRNTGSAISPFNAWLIMQGIETLSLRMERHTENAQAVARVPRGPPAGRMGRVRRPGELALPRPGAEVHRGAARRRC
jgi:O-acetylhomoserine (thiol)-lyase